jgi:SPP1 gp7 family putative phage head morphogenesis protein
MADYGAKFAERKIRKVDRQLQAEYRQAEKELKEKLADFVRRSKAQDAYKRKQVEAGIITEKEYEDWLKGQVFQKKRWESKIKSVQEIMHNHNVEAAKMIHENKLDVYNENYLYQQYEMEMITGMSFDIYSEQAVAKLIKDREQLLPEWKIDEEKDYKWNYRKVNNAITQGIIQGESVDKIMARLARDLCSMNESKMRMFARTAITGAQNAGHQQQMADAEKELGIKQLKQWVATLDMRTRDTHRHLDGQEVPYNKPFHSDLGLIRFPGDPEAEPGNVYNCRCDMITIYPEYRTEQDNWRESETIDGQSYKDWKENKKVEIEKTTGSVFGIIEKTSRYNDKSYKINEQIKQLESEYSSLYSKQLLKFGTPEYDEITVKMSQIDKEIGKLQEKVIAIQVDRDKYLSEEGEKDIKKIFGKIKGKHNAALDAKSVNTITQDPRTQNNCAPCALAFDARRRGIDCEARLSYGTNNGEIETWWKGIKIRRATSYWGTDAREEIRGIANTWGEGARGIVQVDWSKTGGHTFAFEVVNGRCMFIDPQTGVINADDNFVGAMPGTICYARTDDKPLTKAAIYGLKLKGK